MANGRPSPHARACQLAESSRNLLLRPPEKGPHTNHFPSLTALEERLHAFARHYESIAKPFEWRFTRKDLESLLDRIGHQNGGEHALPKAA